MAAFEATNEELVRRMADVFVNSHVGQRVTYQMLSKTAKLDITQHRYFIFRALRIANQEVGAIYRNVRLIGYERLPNAEAYGKGLAARVRGRRIHRSAIRVMENAMRHANDLTPDQSRKNWSEITHNGWLVHQSYDRNAPAVPLEPLPPDPAKVAAKCIDAMREALGRTK